MVFLSEKRVMVGCAGSTLDWLSLTLSRLFGLRNTSKQPYIALQDLTPQVCPVQ